MEQNYENLYAPNEGEALVVTPMPQTMEKPKISFSRSEHTISVILLLGGFLIMRLGVIHPSGLLTTLLYWALIVLELVFLKQHGTSFRLSDKAFAAVLFLFACVYTITANELIKGLNTLFLIMTDCLFLFRLTDPEADVFRFLPFSLMRAVFAMPFAHFGTAFSAASSGSKSKAFWKNAAYVLAGLVIAVPMTIIVGALLVDADDNMSALLGGLLEFEPVEPIQQTVQFLIGLLIGSAIFSALWSTVNRTVQPDTENCEQQIEACRFVPNVILYAAVTPICLLYVLFFIAQMQYFLGGFTGSTAGYTYAEYARQGFFQLCTVCCINLGVIAGMGFLAKHSGAVKPLVLKIYSIYLCICSLFLAGTAIAKMCMYISVYGMTQLRVYTTWFMCLLVIGFGALLVRQFVPKLNLGKIAAVTFTILFGLLCFARPDALIVHYNADRYLAGTLEEFDTSVLEYKSYDAWAALSFYSPEEREQLGIDNSINEAVERVEHDFYRGLNLSAWELMSNG